MRLQDLKVFFLDLQTTGANPKQGEVLEIAWGDLSSPTYSALVRQEKGTIPSAIQRITGIRDSDLAQAEEKNILKEKLLGFQNQVGVIHFASFEKAFLNSWFDNQIPFSILCTHDIAKRLFPNLPTRSLKGLAGFFGHEKENLKRAASHVEATKVIWRALILELEKRDVNSLEALQDWLAQDFKRKKEKYEYPLDKSIRLGLSQSPGIYRMLNKNGTILYVGKATNLHSRVNSYFRGQKNRDAKKLEMLTQVWNVQVTECRSPLEAALLETDEIKKWDPPYNINLKTANRKLAFFTKNFLEDSPTQTEVFSQGPFSNRMVLDSIRKLSLSLSTGIFLSDIFYEDIDTKLLEEGFHLFCTRQEKNPEIFKSIRTILAYGIHLLRQNKEDMAEELESEPEEHEESDPIVTAQDIADKFERSFQHAAAAYLRGRALTRLLDSAVEYPITSEQNHKLYFHHGKMVSETEHSTRKDRKISDWKTLNVEDYDRMSVLFAELTKLRNL